MTVTPSLKRQHIEILNVANELIKHLNTFKSQPCLESEKKVVKLVNNFFGKLFIHLSIKDKIIYPGAIDSPNKALSATALDIMSESGNLKLRFLALREKYFGKPNINNLATFANDLLLALKILKRCSEREEKELYPLMSNHLFLKDQ